MITTMGSGRFAPSPTGDLHLGNLRTALVAWLSARSQGLSFRVRMEDLDRATSSPAHERAQLASLRAIGLDWDDVVVRQSERFDRYRDAIRRLTEQGQTYECFCTRREIREAAQAPQAIHVLSGTESVAADGAYPGTCRHLDDASRHKLLEAGRRPALRLRGDDRRISVHDEVHGAVHGIVDDVVLQRNDGVPAYNLAVVVDDAAQSVVEVVRGDDLLSSTPRQVALQQLLELPTPRYRHVPLVLGADGARLAKRHGAVTLADCAAAGLAATSVVSMLATSLGLAAEGDDVSPAELVARFRIDALPRQPWILAARLQRSVG
jgi:glutamyl-tRNA synthetase